MKSIALTFFAFLVVLAVSQRVYFRYWDPRLRITFFDVGQGDATLVQFPGGETLLIDAGGGSAKWNVGEAVLKPELSRIGVLRLDAALLTHPDQDHIQGFFGILKHFELGVFWINASFLERPNRSLSQLLEKLKQKEIPVRPFAKPSGVALGGVGFTVDRSRP